METIGHYRILRLIGKGGMGEVLLAFDPVFKREIAVKRIRKDLKNYTLLKERFLKEAQITGQFTHPNIISIYTIHQEQEQIYYTMPYIEGKTLKQLLRQHYEALHTKAALIQEKLTDPSINDSFDIKKEVPIPTLMRIFFAICQAVAYAHSKGFLHRDLKPENILVGTYGEVVILDWGLAQLIGEEIKNDNSLEFSEEDIHLTRPGKIVGTLAYMAPERAFSGISTVKTDVYALGIMLYQILTLRLPFQRTTLKDFRKTMHHEVLVEPIELAPYRDVPPQLAQIVKKCLDPNPELRYQNMSELIHAITNYMEGRSDWIHLASIDVSHKDDWEFQENVLISRNIAITRTIETADWVSIMISKASFPGNIRLATQVKINELGQGIGFLLNVPESSERKHPHDGYCLWLGVGEGSGALLFRNSIEVLKVPELFLNRNQWYEILIEKIDNNLYCIIDGIRRFTYVSHLPLAGTHVGILSQDANYLLQPLDIAVGSLQLQVSCLAIPDAFLAHNDYNKAIAEYRRIGYSFPGHAEGREALFRSGIALLEQSKSHLSKSDAMNYYNLAIDEFGKLHKTPGAPLEYLGKALVYEALHDYAEEVKCLELALRRYRKHPLISTVKEHIIYRMHESSQRSRLAAYNLIWVALRHMPEITQKSETKKLFKHLISHWELLPFLDNPTEPSFLINDDKEEERSYALLNFATPLIFWLAQPHSLVEIFHGLQKLKTIEASAFGNVLFSCIELGSHTLAQKLIDNELQEIIDPELQAILDYLDPIFVCEQTSLQSAIEKYIALPITDVGIKELRTACYLMQYALRTEQPHFVHNIAAYLRPFPLSLEDQIQIDSYRIWAFLSISNWNAAEQIFQTYPLELLNQETTLLHPLFGCWLYVAEGEEIARIHFSGVVDTPFPRTWALLSHQLTNNLTESPHWMNNSFLWERRALYRQLSLFYHCSQQHDQELFYRHLERKEYIYVE